jgi:hypothetical protein
LLLFVLATLASVQTTEGSAGAGVSAVQPQTPHQEERKICKRIDATGSRTAAKRLCKTAAEWNAYNEAATDALPGQGGTPLRGTAGRARSQ